MRSFAWLTILSCLCSPAFAASSEETARRLVYVLNAPDGEKRYFGSKVSLESVDASVPEVLRLVGHSSGLNVLWDKEVDNEKVSMSIKDVPWDQVLDIVISQRGLKVVVSGNVVQVMTSASYVKRLQNAREQQSLEADTAQNALAIIPLTFAKPEEVKRIVEAITEPDKVPARSGAGVGVAGGGGVAIPPAPRQ